MPNYDFYCRECADAVTVLASIEKKINVPVCAKCKQAMVRRFGVEAIQFKGRGWASKEK
tara:strand:+ start:718 stop:894 length:177 start_codon:yes stop_codon:yes gene_type:complete